MGDIANELRERSKNDRAMIVGSDIRAAICELEQERDAALTEGATRQAAFNDLYDAAICLKQEVNGWIGTERNLLAMAVSETNVRCLERAVAKVEAALAASLDVVSGRQNNGL